MTPDITNRTLEEMVEIAEIRSNLRRAAIARHAICGICSEPHYERKATTFCGDCGTDLCSGCASVYHMETYCLWCREYHEANDL